MTRVLSVSLLLLAAGCAKESVRPDAPTTTQPAAAEPEAEPEPACGCDGGASCGCDGTTECECGGAASCDGEGHTNVQPLLDSDEGAIKAFDHKPEPGEKAMCAVSDEPFTVTAETKVAEYNGKWYAFCCDDCAPAFEDDPAEYAVD